MPHIMKHGLYCTKANILRDRGRFYPNAKSLHPELNIIGWDYIRSYRLSNRGKSSAWEGTLWVYARDVEVLSEFRLDHLSADNVYHGSAFRPGLEMIYHFNARSPWKNFNFIYDEMPMKGLWPWPKANEADSKLRSYVNRLSQRVSRLWYMYG